MDIFFSSEDEVSTTVVWRHPRDCTVAKFQLEIELTPVNFSFDSIDLKYYSFAITEDSSK